tara:strand:- start:117 stop:515 length:399 start_codon:yes stop_codon:yes gene_type:complete
MRILEQDTSVDLWDIEFIKEKIMANLSTKIKQYLTAQGKDAQAEFDNETVVLTDIGSGATITTWNVSGVAEPTVEQIASYETTSNTAENNVTVINTRRKAYGDIGDQLDEIFKDIDAWKTRIQAIKDANPKG